MGEIGVGITGDEGHHFFRHLKDHLLRGDSPRQALPPHSQI